MYNEVSTITRDESEVVVDAPFPSVTLVGVVAPLPSVTSGAVVARVTLVGVVAPVIFCTLSQQL